MERFSKNPAFDIAHKVHGGPSQEGITKKPDKPSLVFPNPTNGLVRQSELTIRHDERPSLRTGKARRREAWKKRKEKLD